MRLQPGPAARRWLPPTALIWLSLVVVFLLDLLLDRLLVGASLYVVPVVMTLWLPTTRETAVVTTAALILGGATLLTDIAKGAPAAHAVMRGILEITPVLAAVLAVIVRKQGEQRATARFREWREIADASPALMRGANAEGRVIYANRGWRELTGSKREGLLGATLADIAVENRTELAEAIEESTLMRVSTQAEYAIRAAGGRVAWIFERVTPRLDASGRIVGFVGSGMDVTERHAALHTLSENRERLAEAEQIAELGHVDLQFALKRQVWSDGLFRLLGLEPQQIRPSTRAFLSYVVPEEREAFRTALEQGARSGQWPERRVRVRRADGSVRELKTRARIVLDAEGKPLRVFGTLHDITERQVMARTLLEHQSSLARAQEIANLGSWTIDVRTGELLWSDQMFRLCGIVPGPIPPSVEAFVERVVHPDDRDAFLYGWRKALSTHQPTANEYRIVRTNGSVAVVRAQCEFLCDAEGRLERIVGTCQDVSEMRRAEAALRASEERFDLAARGANDGIWDWPDVREDALWISSRYFELLGYEDGAFAPCGAYFNETHVHPDDLERNLAAVARHLEAREPYDIEIRLRQKSGEYRWFRMRGQATYAPAGSPLRMAGSTQDVHARKQAERQVEDYQEQLRSLAFGATLAAERERRRIGVELHDRTIQNLGLTRVKLAQLRECVDLDGSAPLFDNIYDLVKETIRDTRSLLAEISPPVLYELGFEAAVEWLADQVGTGPGGPPCTLHTDGLPKPLGEGAQVVLFQAARELLANVGKHARASHAALTVSRDGDMLTVQVADDGVGFDPTAVKPPHVEQGGFGLFSIRERLRLLGGTMTIESAPSRGTRVRVTAPLEKVDSAPRLDA